jgi:fatty-acyl-CoA synthase
MTRDGYLTIVDRKKDMIKTGGENVASREVEEAFYQMPGVAEVAWAVRGTAVSCARSRS